MLWLAVHLPLLPLEAFCASLPPPPAGEAQRPVALLHALQDTPRDQQNRVHSVNAAAALRGIKPGIQRATALALAADLLLADRSPPRDAAALQAVVHAALSFTPAVCLQDAHTVLLEVQGSLRLFGGLPALHQRLLQALAPLGHQVQVAAAPTALGAALLAWWAQPVVDAAPVVAADPGRILSTGNTPTRTRPPAPNPARWVLGRHATELPALQALLGRAPLSLLPVGHVHGQALHAMGLHTVADLLALPRDGLSRRFGQGLLDQLDRARGLQSDPRRWLTLPPQFNSRLELHFRAENTDQVLHGATVLLARLVAWAQARQVRVGAFTLRMLHERQRSRGSAGDSVPAVTELPVLLAEPALDASHLQLLLRERLAHCVLAAPTLELQLHCSQVVAAAAPNGELFPSAGSRAEGLMRLLERLCARLGPAQVVRLLPVADHRPERACRAEPAQGAAHTVRAAVADAVAPGASAAPLPLHRPAWLLPEPLPLAERNALPLLEGRALQLLSGPERVETGWWDEHPVARDYFIAMTEDGCLVWVFRSRLAVARGDVNWYLQGRFA